MRYQTCRFCQVSSNDIYIQRNRKHYEICLWVTGRCTNLRYEDDFAPRPGSELANGHPWIEGSPNPLEPPHSACSSPVGLSTVHPYSFLPQQSELRSHSIAIASAAISKDISLSPSHTDHEFTQRIISETTALSSPIGHVNACPSPLLELSPTSCQRPRECREPQSPSSVEKPASQWIPTTTPPRIFNPAFDIPFRSVHSSLPPIAAGEAAIDLSTRQSGTPTTPNQAGRQPSVTVCYTYDAFFISDGRSKKKVRYHWVAI